MRSAVIGPNPENMHSTTLPGRRRPAGSQALRCPRGTGGRSHHSVMGRDSRGYALRTTM